MRGFCEKRLKALPLLLALAVIVSAELCDNGTGECKNLTPEDCPVIFNNLHLIGENNVKYCDEFNDIVCCPIPQSKQHVPPVENTGRSAIECKRYHEILSSECRPTPFIVGGTKADPKEFPFMALIGSRQKGSTKTKWDCGGTLIHPKYVLTAAHCLETGDIKKEQILDPNYDSPKFVVRLGELDHNSTTDDARPQDFVVVNYIVHPSYNEANADSVADEDEDEDEETNHNDIALLELDRNATLNAYVVPACLPYSTGNEHIQLTAAGWGYTASSGESSTHLLKVTLERYSDEECLKRLVDRRIDLRTQFCAGSENRIADTCNGDSGGPIFVQHPKYNCLKQVVGVTSYGLLCGNIKKVPSVYTKVYLYNDWIENIIWNN